MLKKEGGALGSPPLHNLSLLLYSRCRNRCLHGQKARPHRSKFHQERRYNHRLSLLEHHIKCITRPVESTYGIHL